MKKILLASILASMFGLAQAQVSVYGVVDAGIQSYKDGSTRVTRAADNLLATSRLGFKGSEDLGSGFKANFQLEGQLNPSSGSIGSTTVATNEIFNREAWLGLSHTTFGEVRLGRTDMTMTGEMDSMVWQAGNFALMPVNGTSVELGSDQKNVIKYISPRIAGFSAQVARASDAVGATSHAGTTQNAVSVDYAAGNFKAGLGRQVNDGAGAARKDSTSFGVGYDFGVVAVGAAYARGDNSTTADVTSDAGVLSAKVPLSHGLNAHAVYSFTKNGAQATDNRGRGYTLALTKDYSKRTTVYAAYTAVTNQANSSMTMVGATAPSAAGVDTAGLSVGIKHSF